MGRGFEPQHRSFLSVRTRDHILTSTIQTSSLQSRIFRKIITVVGKFWSFRRLRLNCHKISWVLDKIRLRLHTIKHFFPPPQVLEASFRIFLCRRFLRGRIRYHYFFLFPDQKAVFNLTMSAFPDQGFVKKGPGPGRQAPMDLFCMPVS